MTLCLAMYAPLALNSFARLGSTRDTQLVTLLTLSLGVNIPQFEHWTSSLRPLPPLLRPRDLRFFGVLITHPNRNGPSLTTNRLLADTLAGPHLSSPHLTLVFKCSETEILRSMVDQGDVLPK